MATLHLGYRIFAADSGSVYADAARTSNAIAAALDKAGVTKDAIESQGQSTQPMLDVQNRDLSADERARRKFEAQQSWTVKTTPDAVAKVLAVCVTAGANESGQVDWSVSDEASLTAEAGTKALARAKVLATQMANGLGARIGNLMYASNEVEAIRDQFRGGLRQVSGAAMAGAVSAPQLSLSAPMIMRSATVSAIFAIE